MPENQSVTGTQKGVMTHPIYNDVTRPTLVTQLLPGYHHSLRNRIPFAKGMGSSSAVRNPQLIGPREVIFAGGLDGNLPDGNLHDLFMGFLRGIQGLLSQWLTF